MAALIDPYWPTITSTGGSLVSNTIYSLDYGVASIYDTSSVQGELNVVRDDRPMQGKNVRWLEQRVNSMRAPLS